MPTEQDEDQRRQAARFDVWRFGSVWLLIFAVAAVAVLLDRQAAVRTSEGTCLPERKRPVEGKGEHNGARGSQNTNLGIGGHNRRDHDEQGSPPASDKDEELPL